MKKKVIVFAASLFALSLVSAYGSYGSFSLGEFFDSVDSSTIVLGTLFFIFFALLNFSLSKAFKDKEGNPNKSLVTVLSLGISLLLVYWLYKSSYDLQGAAYNLGISQGIIWAFIPWIIIGGVVYLFWKMKSEALLIIGLILILIAVIGDFVYEEGMLTTIGIILILLWIGLKVYEGWKLRDKHKRRR